MSTTETELQELRRQIEAKMLQAAYEREKANACPHCGQQLPEDWTPQKKTEPLD